VIKVQFARFLSLHWEIKVNRVAKVIIVLGVTLVGGVLLAGTAELDIAERLKKVGELCVEGQDCATATATSEVAAVGGFDVTGTYGTSCATCHAIGLAGAPKLGDKVAWEPRLAQGIDVLYDHGINGLAPAMPAKGMCFTCSDDDIRALVDYMVESTQ
jgi:cytochrome c5